MAESNMLSCYNKSCGKKFDPAENKEGSCHHHPGVPVFHDALKGWSCCKKRSTDFTEFLNIPGCTSGLHSNEKPPEPEKPEKTDTPDEVVASSPEVIRPPIEEPPPRPSTREPMVRLKNTVGASLQQALEKQMSQMNLDQAKEQTESDPSEVKEGTPCKNPGCTKSYSNPGSNKETCVYHEGVPIFHEGMKYWSCCQKRTTDFNSFLNQEGCTGGKHLWFKKESDAQKVACRVDWHQTATFVTMSIFAKLAQTDKTWVDINKVSAKMCIVFEGDKKYKKELEFCGVVNPDKSNVKLLATKVEVNLRKTEPGLWPRLELQKS